MLPRREVPRRPRAILWIAAALLVATLLSHLQLSVCRGSCAEPVATPSCCAATDTAEPTGCCGCCGAEDGTIATAEGEPEQPDDDAGTLRPSRSRCCTTAAFAGVELAPAPELVEAPKFVHVAFVPRSALWPSPDRRPLTRGRPFDRGPPRIDARTTLRASTVLRI